MVIVGLAGFVLVLLPGVPPWLAVPTFALAGLGMGLAYSPFSLIVLREAPPAEQGARVGAPAVGHARDRARDRRHRRVQWRRPCASIGAVASGLASASRSRSRSAVLLGARRVVGRRRSATAGSARRQAAVDRAGRAPER